MLGVKHGASLRLLTWREVDELVDPVELVEDIRRALVSVSAPRRSTVTHGGSWFAAMPAAGRGFFSAKLVGVYPDNPARGLPLVRGLLLLFRSSDGELLLAVDAAAATAWRTAAASALALQLLGARRGHVLGVVGSGVQAEYHIRVLGEVYAPSEVLVYSRRWARARRLAQLYGGRVVDARDVARNADVAVLATSATTPPLPGALVREGALVVSVGAPKPVRELDYALLLRARCVLADTMEGVVSEAGDVDADAVEIVDLRGLVRGEARCLHGDVGVYKSVGTAVFDHAIALHLARRLGV